MLKIKFYICALIISCACFWSCKKNQDFTYDQLNELTINANTDFTVMQFDTLKIDPQITQSKSSGESFTYQWKIYDVALAIRTPLIIGTSKALNAVMGLAPSRGGYNLEYKVTNDQTGVSTFKVFKVSITSAFNKGWMVSNTAGGKAQLSFIRSDYKVFLNPAESVNQTTYPGNAVGAYFYTGTSSAGISFFTDQGSFRFDANNFLYSGKSTISFKPVKDKFAFGQSGFKLDEFLINDGGLYALSLIDGPADKIYTDRLVGDYNLYPKVLSSAPFTTYFYDNKYKRFLYVGSFTGFSIFNAAGSTTTLFNLADTRMTMVGAADGAQTFSSGEFFMVMQADNGDRYLYAILGARPTLNQKFLNSPEIASAKSFAASLVLRQLYYATDNSIYLYDILANSSSRVYTFPSNTKIKEIQMDQTDSKTLVVATNNNSAGEVYYFKLNSQGGIIGSTYDQKIGGFGEISGINYRKSN